MSGVVNATPTECHFRWGPMTMIKLCRDSSFKLVLAVLHFPPMQNQIQMSKLMPFVGSEHKRKSPAQLIDNVFISDCVVDHLKQTSCHWFHYSSVANIIASSTSPSPSAWKSSTWIRRLYSPGQCGLLIHVSEA